MPRARAQPSSLSENFTHAVMADSPEELEEQLRARFELLAQQRPNEPGPDEPIVPPAPIPPQPDEEPAVPDEPEETNGDDDESEENETENEEIPADPPNTAAASTGPLTYTSRIAIVDAWQYQGSLANAPDYIDRSWAAFAEYDPLTKTPPGPALRVPLDGPNADRLARRGDYVVRQSVTLDQSLDPIIQVEVWSKAEFERLFIPHRAPL